MARSRKRRVGIGHLDPDADVRKEVHVSAVANPSTTSFSYTVHDVRSEKKPHIEPPPATVGSEQETKPQPKKCNQVFIFCLVLLYY
jgi:hypothetical protein